MGLIWLLWMAGPNPRGSDANFDWWLIFSTEIVYTLWSFPARCHFGASVFLSHQIWAQLWLIWVCVCVCWAATLHIWLWVKTHGIPFWVGEFTAHFRLPIFVVESDVHWGLTDLDFEKPMAISVFLWCSLKSTKSNSQNDWSHTRAVRSGAAIRVRFRSERSRVRFWGVEWSFQRILTQKVQGILKGAIFSASLVLHSSPVLLHLLRPTPLVH